MSMWTMLFTIALPALFCAAAWAIAVWALSLPDENSSVVRRLTEVSPPAIAGDQAQRTAMRSD